MPFAEWESERSAAREAREAEETSEAEVRRQQEAAEAHARQLTEKKETGGPASTLHVTVTSVHGTSYRNPGHTSLYVNTNQFAEVFFKVTYPQHPRWEADYFHFKERLGVKEASWEPGEGNTANDPWSCRAPMLVEDWEVRVEGENGGVVEAGPGLVATGQIVDDVSPKWCATAKRREAAVQAKRRHSSNTRARRRS